MDFFRKGTHLATMGDILQMVIQYKILLVLTWLCIVVGLELLYPFIIAPKNWLRVFKNCSFWFLNSIISVGIILPFSIWASQNTWGWRPLHIDPIVTIIINIIILDFLIYWWHRANHELPLLWRFHKIHHLDEFLDVTTALRFHFGEVLLSTFFRAIIIIIIDISWMSVICFEILVLFSSAFHHSNIRIPKFLDKLVSKVFVTPSIHGIHHHAKERDTNSNYSTIFSVWDRIFTARNSLKLTAFNNIGIEGEKDQPLIHLLIRPFFLRR